MAKEVDCSRQGFMFKSVLNFAWSINTFFFNMQYSSTVVVWQWVARYNTAVVMVGIARGMSVLLVDDTRRLAQIHVDL